MIVSSRLYTLGMIMLIITGEQEREKKRAEEDYRDSIRIGIYLYGKQKWRELVNWINFTVHLASPVK